MNRRASDLSRSQAEVLEREWAAVDVPMSAAELWRAYQHAMADGRPIEALNLRRAWIEAKREENIRNALTA